MELHLYLYLSGVTASYTLQSTSSNWPLVSLKNYWNIIMPSSLDDMFGPQVQQWRSIFFFCPWCRTVAYQNDPVFIHHYWSLNGLNTTHDEGRGTNNRVTFLVFFAVGRIAPVNHLLPRHRLVARPSACGFPSRYGRIMRKCTFTHRHTQTNTVTHCGPLVDRG